MSSIFFLTFCFCNGRRKEEEEEKKKRTVWEKKRGGGEFLRPCWAVKADD